MPFYRASAPLRVFLEPAFMDAYIKRNNVYLVSETKLDHEDTVALVDGVLYLSLTRATYERAGLTVTTVKTKFKAKRSKGKREQFYRLQFDLRAPDAVSGEARFDRLKWALENTIKDAVAVAFTVTAADCRTPVALSSEAVSLFDAYGGLTTSSLRCTSTIYADIAAATVPVFRVPTSSEDASVRAALASLQAGGGDSGAAEADKYSREVIQEWAVDVQEWLGMVALGSDRLSVDDRVDPALCDYRPAFGSGSAAAGATESLTVVTWAGGLIPPGLAWHVWQHMACSDSGTWAAMSVHGVEDAVVSWGARPHSYTLGGENHYVAIKLEGKNPEGEGRKGHDYLLMEITDGGDN